jgi:hypothetical protein
VLIGMTNQLARQGIGTPQSLIDRFRGGNATLTGPGMNGLSPTNPNAITPGMRPLVAGAFAQQRQTGAAMAYYGLGDMGEYERSTGMDAMELLRQQAIAGGQYADAISLGENPYAIGPEASAVFRSRFDAQSAAVRQGRMAAGASLNVQRGNIPMAGQDFLGGARASREAADAIGTEIGFARQSYEAAVRSGNDAAAATALNRYNDLRTRQEGAESQSLGQYSAFASMPFNIETQRVLSQSSYQIAALETVPGTYGNIRGALTARMGALEQGAAEIMQRRDTLQREGAFQNNPALALQMQEQLQGIGLQQAQTFGQLSAGWENRLVGTLIGHPGNFSLEGRGFSYRNALMRGVMSPYGHFGSSSTDLPGFLSGNMLNRIPMAGLPGVKDPFNFDLPTNFSGLPDFPTPPMGPGGDSGLPGPLGGGLPHPGRGAPPRAGQGANATGGGPEIKVSVTIHDERGNVLGHGSNFGVAGDLQDMVARGGLEDTLVNMGVNTARQV